MVQRCTVALNDNINNIGRIMQNGVLDLDQDKFKKWIFSSDKGCPLHAMAIEKLAVPYQDTGKFITNETSEPIDK